MNDDPTTSHPDGDVSRMPPGEERGRRKRNPFGIAVAVVVAALSALYIVNPGAGFFELLPDNLPIAGNLDEAAATALLLSMLAYLGINIQPLRQFLEKLDRK